MISNCKFLQQIIISLAVPYVQVIPYRRPHEKPITAVNHNDDFLWKIPVDIGIGNSEVEMAVFGTALRGDGRR